MLLPYQSNITTLIVYARPNTMFWLFTNFFFLLFSRLNYELVWVFKVQVKLCTSVNFFFSHRRKREAEVDKRAVWFFYRKKQTNKQKAKNKNKKRTLDDILPTHKIFDKFWIRSHEKLPPLLRPTPVRQRMFTPTNQSVDSIWPTWF